jgi:hypothetical protein
MERVGGKKKEDRGEREKERKRGQKRDMHQAQK